MKSVSASRLFELLLASAWIVAALSPSAVAVGATDLLKESGVQGGVVVHLGCGDATLTAQLRAGSQYLVQGLDLDADKVSAARKRLLAAGEYGPVAIHCWDGRRLPYADSFVNLIIAENPAQAPDEEILRVLAPGGVVMRCRAEKWEKTTKAWPREMDQWTHYLHSSDGNPAGNDTLVGPPKRLQWLGSPGWARHHDHMASMTSLVSANGRLFYILDEGSRASIRLPSKWRLIARDAFNGTVLWKHDIPEWASKEFALKSGPAHLLRRLVAVGDRVYVTLGIDAPVSILDAASGKPLGTCEGSRYAREIVVADRTVLLVTDNERSRLPDFRRVGTYVWANTMAANSGWGWEGEARNLLAYDAAGGKVLWKHETPVAPCSLAADAARIVFHDGQKLVCLDRRTGRPQWEAEAAPVKLPVPSSTGPRVLLYQDVVLFAGNDGKMSGWSLENGEKLWEQKHKSSGHMSLKDLFVVEGLAWTAAIANNQDDGIWTGYDPRTGEKKREFPPDVNLHWFHHRCYPSKACGKYLITGRNGTEYVDVDKETWTPNHWVRGGCIYGVMPCNGMTYASMDACGCQLEAKLSGFKALASGPVPEPTAADLAQEARLERGPAYGKAGGPAAGEADWPMYRRDAARSGATATGLSPGAGRTWEAKLGGRLTPPTIAAGKLFVAQQNTHTLFALDAATGEVLWSYTTGGPTDSPPTYDRGLVLFGSADGYVYALRANDGSLAWRFRAAPLDRRVMAWEEIESVWPVHGSVLVGDGVVFCTAGRSIYLDGGIRFVKLEAATGKLLGEVVWDDQDPLSDKDMHWAYLQKTPGNTMPVGLSDILSCDGRNLWMRSQKIDFDGKRSELEVLPASDQPADDFHLFSQIGFVDDSYFFRSYWTYGRRMTGGYGGWYQAGRYVPSGRILCFDEQGVYGYGRQPQYMVNASLIEYHLFAAEKVVGPEDIDRVNRAERAMNARRPERNATSSDWRLRSYFPREDLSAMRYRWAFEQPAVFTRAMVAAGDRLYLAGPPDVVDERYAYHNPDDPRVLELLDEQDEALAGFGGGQLWAVNKSDGSIAARYSLDTMPVFDGLAAAGGRLYLTTADGRVLSWSATGIASLPSVDGKPQTLWEKPEDPDYLLPLPERKEGDFAAVSGCKVFSSKLGYQLRADAKDTVGFAVRKLDQPLTGTITFRTRLRAVPDAKGLLRNGFLVFGNGTDEAALVKCGTRLQSQTSLIHQGPLAKSKAQSAPIEAPEEKGAALEVMVDLTAGKLTYTANGVTQEASLARPLDCITHVGYAVIGAAIDAAPIQVETR